MSGPNRKGRILGTVGKRLRKHLKAGFIFIVTLALDDLLKEKEVIA